MSVSTLQAWSTVVTVASILFTLHMLLRTVADLHRRISDLESQRPALDDIGRRVAATSDRIDPPPVAETYDYRRPIAPAPPQR